MTKPFDDTEHAEWSAHSERECGPAVVLECKTDTTLRDGIAKIEDRVFNLDRGPIPYPPGHPFAGLSKLIDEVTEEGSVGYAAVEEQHGSLFGIKVDGRPLQGTKFGPANVNDGYIDCACMYSVRLDDGMDRFKCPGVGCKREYVRLSCGWTWREPASSPKFAQLSPAAKCDVVSNLLNPRDEDGNALPPMISKQTALELLEMPTLDELTPVEPLSTAITTYATGPLSPGERHEARVVASRGRLTVHHGGRSVSIYGLSVRDPRSGNELCASIECDVDGSFEIVASDVAGEQFDGDVVVGFAVTVP